MFFEEIGKKSLEHLTRITVQGSVFFFINGFQLGVKNPQNRISETFCLHRQILIQRTSRYVICVHRLLK